MSENTAESFLASLPADWAETCRGNGLGDYGNACHGYANTDSPCATCCLMNKLMQDSAGFVETDSLLNMETDNFPVTLIAYRGERTIPVLHVRMDSISVQESKVCGYVDILFEVYGTDITGTIPMVDYFTTESDV